MRASKLKTLLASQRPSPLPLSRWERGSKIKRIGDPVPLMPAPDGRRWREAPDEGLRD